MLAPTPKRSPKSLAKSLAKSSAKSPAKPPGARRGEPWTCPNCALCLTVTHDRDGTTVGYDIGGWARLCACMERGGPLTCPWVQRELWNWLSPQA